MLESLAIFHIKTLNCILNVSKYAYTPAIHFLLGELPIEGKIHRYVFFLFFCIWRNPDSKVYSIIKYLLEISYFLDLLTYKCFTLKVCHSKHYPTLWTKCLPPMGSSQETLPLPLPVVFDASLTVHTHTRTPHKAGFESWR